jgi:hypothetical protein
LESKLSAGTSWKNLALNGLPTGASENFGLRTKLLIYKEFFKLAERVETDLSAQVSELIAISSTTSPSDTPIDTPSRRRLQVAFGSLPKRSAALAAISAEVARDHVC